MTTRTAVATPDPDDDGPVDPSPPNGAGSSRAPLYSVDGPGAPDDGQGWGPASTVEHGEAPTVAPSAEPAPSRWSWRKLLGRGRTTPPPDLNAEPAPRVPAPLDAEPVATEELGRPAEDVPLAVDPPTGRLTAADLLGIDLPERKVIVPRWLKSRADARAVAEWVARYVGYAVTFHATRAPVYVVRALVRLAVGVGRAVGACWAWLWDAQGRQMAGAALMTVDQAAWNRARKEWKDTVHRRLVGTAVGAVAALVMVLLAWWWLASVTADPTAPCTPDCPSSALPEQVLAVAVAVAVALLIRLGRPEDEAPILDRYYSDKPGASFKLRPDMVIEALTALRIDGMKPSKNQPAEELVELVSPVMIDGPGWRVDVDLPRGVTAAQVMEKRPELASALRRPLGTVWPSADPSVHAGRVTLWCGHREISALALPAPYAKPGWTCDVFEPIPFGFDQRGEAIDLSIMYANVLIGAKPGAGKTAAVRGIVAAVALDPTVKLRLADHKGAGDLQMFEPLADVYISGALDEDVEATLGVLRGLEKECARRSAKLGELAKTSDLAPQSKVTRQTASMRSLGLEPIVCVIDECQEVFGHEGHGREAGRIAERVIRKGRALGIMLVLVTQRPDKTSLPTGITANVSRRFCLKVEDQVTNDMILGTSAYRMGIQATTLSPKDEGVGYLKGEFDDARIVRTYYMDNDEATEVAQRALARRKAEGRLTGAAVGEIADDAPVASLLDDLPEVFATAERLHSTDIVAALQTLRPGTYDEWTVTTFAGAMRDQLGLRTTPLKITGTNKAGLKRVAVLEAVAARLVTAEGESPAETIDDADGA